MVVRGLFPLLALTFSLVSASPAARYSVKARQSITTLTTTQISAFEPYAFYASTGYCSPSTTINWSCGGACFFSYFALDEPENDISLAANCEANPSFIPVASGGDGVDVQFWFVGFDPTLNTVIVSHQGTTVDTMYVSFDDLSFRAHHDLFQCTVYLS